jgi:hypothetical protein
MDVGLSVVNRTWQPLDTNVVEVVRSLKFVRIGNRDTSSHYTPSCRTLVVVAVDLFFRAI